MQLPRFILPLALGLVTLPAMAGTVTYDYTGADFTIVNGSTYTTSDNISGTFTVAAPLAANLSNTYVAFTSYSFTDGVQTLTNQNATTERAYFYTDASGNITGWYIDVVLAGSDQILSASTQSLDLGEQSNQNDGEVIGQEKASNFSIVGSSSSATPEPSSLALLGTGVAGIFEARRRIMRRA